MALWDKLKVELDRAGRVAQDALDESKLRLEVFRARQLADRAAQALGYAVYRSRTADAPLDDAALQRLVDAVAERDREVASLESRIREREAETAASPSGAAGAEPPAAPGSASAPGAPPDMDENPSPS